jgi:hypothetical protein
VKAVLDLEPHDMQAIMYISDEVRRYHHHFHSGLTSEEQNRDGETILKQWAMSCYISCMDACLGKAYTHQALRLNSFG